MTVQAPPMNALNFEMNGICALAQQKEEHYDHGKNATGILNKCLGFSP